MRLKWILGLAFAIWQAGASSSAFAQVVQAAVEPTPPWTVGLGASGFDPGWLKNPIYGGAIWVDFTPSWTPKFLRGFGVEAEARSVFLGRSSSEKNLREDVGEGGVIYTWRHFHNVRPYGKFYRGYGNTEFETAQNTRYEVSRTISSAGGGVEFWLARSIWLRADYEDEIWPNFFPGGHPSRIDPRGFTVGASYHFNRLLRFR